MFSDSSERQQPSSTDGVLLEEFLERDEKKMLMLTSACSPFHIEWVNSAWSKICGWSSEEIQGAEICSAQFPLCI
jgi:hypothetical protein